jgi:hypothetical protein
LKKITNIPTLPFFGAALIYVFRIANNSRKEDILRLLAVKEITHTHLGAALGLPAQGPWNTVLDQFGRDETQAGRPDITYMVVKVSTGYPGQIESASRRAKGGLRQDSRRST